MEIVERGCQNCRYQHLQAHEEPCKTCMEKWVNEQKHSTGWKPIREMGEAEET